jgi:hypothetical protein
MRRSGSCRKADWAVVSCDTDFGALFARDDRTGPSFVLLPHVNELTPDQQADLLISEPAQNTVRFVLGWMR